MQFCWPEHLIHTWSQGIGQWRLSSMSFLHTCNERFILFCKSSVLLLGQTDILSSLDILSSFESVFATVNLFLFPTPLYVFLMCSCLCPHKQLNSSWYLKYSDLHIVYFVINWSSSKQLLSAFFVWISFIFPLRKNKKVFRLTNVN